MLRKAGDLFAQFNDELREGRLSANRSQPIGAGSYGVVYQSDIPGNVIKQNHPHRFMDDLETEANLQDIGARLGISPEVIAFERYPEGTQRIEMPDIRDNYQPLSYSKKLNGPVGMDAVKSAQQELMLALNGVDIGDRHTGNMQKHFTGRLTQLDYGKARRVEGEDQVAAITNATQKGLAAAGLPEEAAIFSEIVYDYLAGGQVKEAMDIAKQGASRLQKIKAPLKQDSSMLAKLEAKVAAQDPVLANILAH